MKHSVRVRVGPTEVRSNKRRNHHILARIYGKVNKAA